MAQRQGGAGAFGPYKHGNRWRVLVRDRPDDRGGFRSFATEAAAIRYRDGLRAKIAATREQGRTVTTAIDAYARHLDEAGKRQGAETIRRARAFLVDHLDDTLSDLTPRDMERAYDALTKRKATRWVGSGENRKQVELDHPLSVDSHRGYLTHTKTFLKWCVGQRWIRANPLADVEGRGRKVKGKVQLRIDEAREWYRKALELAPTEPGAVATLCALLLGMRASEIVSREVRDLDDGGRVLWIDDTTRGFRVKSERGRRAAAIPDVLHPFLAALAAGKDRSDLLFGGVPARYVRKTKEPRPVAIPHRRGWVLHWTKRIAELAKVPAVSAHSLRGLAADLSVRRGAVAEIVAEALGHSPEVMAAHYAQPGSAAEAARARGIRVLDGGAVTNAVSSGSGEPRK